MATSTKKCIITKDLCYSYASTRKKSNVIISVIISIIIVPIMFLINIKFGLAAIAISAFKIFVDIKEDKKKSHCIKENNFHIELDTSIVVKEREITLENNLSLQNETEYIFYFINNGEYHIRKAKFPFSSQNNKTKYNHDQILNDATRIFKADETYYILIFDLGSEKKIMQIFNTRLYDISPDDFIKTNDNFYPKS